MKKSLNSLLNQLNLIENNAVFFRNKEDGATFDYFSADINKKLDTIRPDAFFVFNKQPLVLFFDLTLENIETKNESEIHKQVWSFDTSPVIFIIKDTDIKIYNALNFTKNKGLEEIKLSDAERNKQFSFWNLQSGATFEWFYEKHKKTVNKKRVNQQLFENIKQTILFLKSKFDLEEGLAKILILRLIFIRYLIDRKIKIDEKHIQGDREDLIGRRKALSDLIAKPKELVQFFDYLNDRFNGVLFKKSKENSNKELTIAQADILSKLFNPDGVNQEEIKNLFSDTKLEVEFRFEVFDFGIIPVELISGIYETLLDEETKNATSAVYTPPFLVDYILTETVDKFFDKNKSISECKIFDPAMGSGIFLVQGLRRMIEREKELNPNDDNETFGIKIKEIAERNLFGIDINQEAIDVACFSIYVALLDYQEPGDINTYIFPTLSGKNFFKVHFFDLSKETILDKIKTQKVNFILGNPPWKNNSSPEHLDWLKKTKFNKIVSDKQIAQSYLIRVKDFVEEDSKIVLIVTSKVFYNNKAQNFKNYFLNNNSVSEIFDLSAVRDIVFENAKNPASIVFFQVKFGKKEINSQSIIKYSSLKRNKFFNSFSKSLVIEKLDKKRIQQKHFIENEWMFKVALYGNTLDYVFFKRFKIGNLKNHLNSNNVKYGKGIELGNPKKPFPFLENLQLIKKENYTNIFIDKSNIDKLKNDDIYVKAGRELSLFDENKIILGKRTIKETNLKFAYSYKNSTFTENFYGIAFEEDTSLNTIFSYLSSNFFLYYQYLSSANWGVYNPEINLNEYLSFPFIEPNEIQKKKLVALVDELLKPYKDHYDECPTMAYQSEPNPKVLEKINTIIEEIYDIKGYEKDLIDYVLNVSRYQFQESKQRLVSDFNHTDHRNKEKVLKNYAAVYIQEFEKIYDDEFFKVEVYDLEHFITMHFILLETKPKEQFEIIKEINNDKKLFEKLSTLSISKIANNNNNDNEFNLFIQKDIKGFEQNSFYIIKPSEYKCWHRAMAWYDVGEFREAIQKAELEHFNNNLDEF